MINWESVLISLSDEEFRNFRKQVLDEEDRRFAHLTDEEKQMKYISCIKAVRQRLGIDLGTAKAYVQAAYIKLGRT